MRSDAEVDEGVVEVTRDGVENEKRWWLWLLVEERSRGVRLVLRMATDLCAKRHALETRYMMNQLKSRTKEVFQT